MLIHMIYFCCLDNSLQEFVKNLDEKIVVFYPDDFVCFSLLLILSLFFVQQEGRTFMKLLIL
ncbi:hypothetical protein BANRA_01180 [Escherichia coli]|nr:hypothetical protein BANRA_01180 [Escherichia coli]